MAMYFVFDVESVGLHGEGYAYGYVVIDHEGHELFRGEASCEPCEAKGDQSGRDWIAANCPALCVSCDNPFEVRKRFLSDWSLWKSKGAVMVADCPWPVEARFLLACAEFREFDGPYPLIDVSSVVLAAGGDPTATFERLENELPKHNPLCDARQSARVLVEHTRTCLLGKGR